MQSPLGPVGPVHLPDSESIPGQNTGQFGPVGSGSLDTYRGDGTVAGQVAGDLPVAATDGQELAVPKTFSILGDQGDMVGIGVGVDAGNDFDLFVCHDGTSSSETAKATGWLMLTSRADRTARGPLDQAPMKSCPAGQHG